jgi:hypothetical protein
VAFAALNPSHPPDTRHGRQITHSMNLKNSLLAPVFAFAIAVSARGQTNTTSTNTPPLNIFEQALQSTIVNTNSTFFDTGGLELRALTQTTLTSYQSVLSGTYYFTNHVGLGAELVNGALNVVDGGYVTLEYGIPYHNVKLIPLAGVGYDLINRGPAVEAGIRLEVAISQNMFADTEDILEVPTHDFTGNNISDTFRIGIGWKF